MTFDNTKYSHLSDEELLRTVLYGRSPVTPIELSLAIRLLAALTDLSGYTDYCVQPSEIN